MSKAKAQLPAVSTEPTAPIAGRFLEPFTASLPQDVHFCTLPCQTREEIGRLYRTIESATERLWDMRGTTIKVRDIVVVSSEEEDGETGEIRPTKRLILITPDGFACQTPSAAARRALYRQLCRISLPPLSIIPPYNPPLRIEVTEQKSTDKSKGPWLHLIVNVDDGPNGNKVA